ncbi:MAG: hypothetical protein ACFFBD_09700, partial [Candidatus Hodarchaeota archaeon]
ETELLVEIALRDQREWGLDLLTPGNPFAFGFGIVEPFLQAFDGLKRKAPLVYEAKSDFRIKPVAELQNLPVVAEVRWASDYLRQLRQLRRGPHYYFKANITGIYTLARAIPLYSDLGASSALYDKLSTGLIQIAQMMKKVASNNLSHIQIDEPALGQLPFYEMTKPIIYQNLIQNMLPAMKKLFQTIEEPTSRYKRDIATCIHCPGELDVDIADILLKMNPFQIGIECAGLQKPSKNIEILSYLHENNPEGAVGVGVFPGIPGDDFWDRKTLKNLLERISEIYPAFVYIQSNFGLHALPYPEAKAIYGILAQLLPEKLKR